MNQLSYIEFNLRPPFVPSVTDPDGSIARATGPTVIFSAPTDGVDRSRVLIDLHRTRLIQLKHFNGFVIKATSKGVG